MIESSQFDQFLFLEHPPQVAFFWRGGGEAEDASQCQQLDQVSLEEIVLFVSHAVEAFGEAEVVLLQQDLSVIADVLIG